MVYIRKVNCQWQCQWQCHVRQENASAPAGNLIEELRRPVFTAPHECDGKSFRQERKAWSKVFLQRFHIG